MTAPSPERLGQRLVAVVFGPAVAVAAMVATAPVAPWVVALGAVNLAVAVGVFLSPSRAVRELGSGWMVLSTVLGVLAMGAVPPG